MRRDPAKSVSEDDRGHDDGAPGQTINTRLHSERPAKRTSTVESRKRRRWKHRRVQDNGACFGRPLMSGPCADLTRLDRWGLLQDESQITVFLCDESNW